MEDVGIVSILKIWNGSQDKNISSLSLNSASSAGSTVEVSSELPSLTVDTEDHLGGGA